MTDQERYEIMYDEIVDLKNEIKHKDDLINRQKAEIERLQGAVEMYEEERKYHFEMSRKKVAEAIRKFARKLKCGVPQESGIIWCADIDNLVKEMVGDSDD